ncbi:TPA: hypothetical protein ACKP0H_003224 [Serratia marcescens]
MEFAVNLDNNRSGSVALQEAIQQPDASDELRDALMALEWRRQVLNTQLPESVAQLAAWMQARQQGLPE